MTIDEMIRFLQSCAQIGQPEFSQIEAALKAGQQMRQLIEEIADSESLICCYNWDKATRGKYEQVD